MQVTKSSVVENSLTKNLKATAIPFIYGTDRQTYFLVLDKNPIVT